MTWNPKRKKRSFWRSTIFDHLPPCGVGEYIHQPALPLLLAPPTFKWKLPPCEVHHSQGKKDLHYSLRHCHNHPTARNRRVKRSSIFLRSPQIELWRHGYLSYPGSIEFIHCSLIEQSFLSVTVWVSNFLMNDRFFMIFFVAVITFWACRRLWRWKG